MIHQTQHPWNLNQRRSAFTLVELLVVMGIIAILATLAIATMAPILENSRASATKAIILHVDQQLQRRLSAFNELKDLKPESGESVLANAVRKKHRYVQEFPQRLMDLYGTELAWTQNSASITAGPTGLGRSVKAAKTHDLISDSSLFDVIVARYIDKDGNKLNIPPPPASNLTPGSSDWETARADRISAINTLNNEKNNDGSPRISSSELIYILLTEGRALGTESYNLDGIPAKYITDSDGDGLMEIRDAWGNELRFYNAPTGLFRPRVASSDVDIHLTEGARIHFASIPGDNGTDTPPTGELYYDPFDKLGRTEPIDSTYTRLYYPNTFFSYLIVSAGPDGALGLNEPEGIGAARLATPITQDDLFDNITNRQQ